MSVERLVISDDSVTTMGSGRQRLLLGRLRMSGEMSLTMVEQDHGMIKMRRDDGWMRKTRD